MANSKPRRHCTDRDLDILLALDRCPLTVRQLFELSEAFPGKVFTSIRSVQDRLHKMRAAGWLRCWPYAVANRGAAPQYYKPTLLGYRLLHGEDAVPSTKRQFAEIGVARHQHTYNLAEFLVHTIRVAHRRKLRLENFYRENTLRLVIGQETLWPDCAFELHTPDGRQFNFLVEIDNGTERVCSTKNVDSWQRKIRLYYALQAQSRPARFRVLILASRCSRRLAAILELARQLAPTPQLSLFYGTHLPRYLAHRDPLRAACFTDHRGRPVPLIPRPQIKTRSVSEGSYARQSALPAS